MNRFKAMFVCLILFCFSIGLARAGQVSQDASLTLARPSHYDGDRCDQIVFSDKVFSIVPVSIPASARSRVTRSTHPSGLSEMEINFYAGGGSIAQIKILGKEDVLLELERDLSKPSLTKITEFRSCAENDPSYKLVEFVSFQPQVDSLKVDIQAGIRVIRKNDQGVCAPMFYKTLAELIKMKSPDADLSNVSARVTLFSHGRLPSTGEVISKRIWIQFQEKTAMFSNDVGPSLSIAAPSVLIYSIIDELSSPNRTLTVTGVHDCVGDRADNPFWINDLKIQ